MRRLSLSRQQLAIIVLVVLITVSFFNDQKSIFVAEENEKEIEHVSVDRNSSLVLDAQEEPNSIVVLNTTSVAKKDREPSNVRSENIDKLISTAVVNDNNSALAEKSPTPLDAIDIPMNQDSTFVQSDVFKIIHIPSETRIEVHLKPNRRCQDPFLQGRISGWSLSMIQFEKITQNNVVVGNYDLQHIPISGQYYLEVLVVLCEKYGDDYRSMNFRGVEPCSEVYDDDRHQLTANKGNATLDLVAMDNDSKLSKDFKGRWVHKSLLSNDRQLLPQNETFALKRPRPTYTPYQPVDGGNSRVHGKYRRDIMYQYVYQWNEVGSDAVLNQPGLSGLLPPKEQQESGSSNSEDPNASKTHVCFVGASHSKEFKNGCHEVLEKTLDLAKEENLTTSLVDNFYCTNIDIRYPANIGFYVFDGSERATEGVSEANLHNLELLQCTHVVVGMFQWYFSFVPIIDSTESKNPKNHFSFDEWKDGMSRAVKVLGQRSSSSSSSIRRVYLRSAHPNGFSARQITCQDFRTVYNSKIATEILREIADEHEVSFMDTSFLMDAIWDTAQDWNHYTHQFRFTESQLVLSQIINESA
eukprot:CAMPEP_0116142534 /NCGR_PEP_ID=MMETSP0329-20121206/14961_1 /TAXON_ID=697910 /ORGANISM="Pseudo-nitzschia arenysensis, Strain B593" /LENGTH=582 /DNA_ID=CAMNT_0003637779 /DNA_START=16 /DNA_END=1764 /DNA_ORIENTATION=-